MSAPISDDDGVTVWTQSTGPKKMPAIPDFVLQASDTLPAPDPTDSGDGGSD